MISLNIEKTLGFISKEKVSAYEAQVKAAQETLENGTGKGNDFLGWLHLPSSISPEHLADLKATAQVLRENCEVVIVAGIGGSYLGARAVIEALSNSFTWLQDKKTAPVIIYAGHNIGEDYRCPERCSTPHCRQRRIQIIYYPRQRRRTFLRTDSGRSATYRSGRI